MDNAPLNKFVNAIAGGTSVALIGLTLYTAYFGVFPDGIQRSLHLLLVMILVFARAVTAAHVFVEEQPKSGAVRLLARFWVLLALIGAVLAVGHQFWNFDAINSRYGAITDDEIVLGVILVIVLFDACRRTVGWPIVILAALFIAYGLFGNYLPVTVGHRGYSLQRVVSQIYLGGGGIFGTPLGVSATFVTGVVVLGALLEKTGAGQVLMRIGHAQQLRPLERRGKGPAQGMGVGRFQSRPSPNVPSVVREGTRGSRTLSSQKNITSSASNGSPSDHLMPLIRCMVSCVPSSDHS